LRNSPIPQCLPALGTLVTTDFSRASFKTALLIQQVLVTAYLIYVYSSALRIRHRLAMKTSAECHTSFEGTLGNRPRNGLTLGLFR